jgi:hypothetical protein
MTDESRDDVAATLDAIQERIKKQREALNETARGESAERPDAAPEGAETTTTESAKKTRSKTKTEPTAEPATKSRSKAKTEPTAEAAAEPKTETTQKSVWASVTAFLVVIGTWLAKFFGKVWGWLKAAGAAVALFVKTKIFKQDASSEQNASSESSTVESAAEKKTAAATSSSEDAESSTEPVAPKRDFSFLKRKSVLFGGIGAIIVIILLIVGFANFAFVTTEQGIETTLGSSEGRTVLIAKGSTASQSDLVVAVLPGTTDTDAEQLIMGTVFSMNDQTYALYDGEVIWQIPLDDVKGRVLFASATQVP